MLLLAALAVTACAPADSPTGGDGEPVVTILSPAAGLVVQQGASVTFVATAHDPENGDLTTSIEWHTAQGEWLGSGGTIQAILDPGVRQVIARVRDSDGNTAFASVGIEVEEDLSPSVTMHEPADGLVVSEGTEIDFVASATDAEDGDLTSEIEWRSFPGGVFGEGAAASLTPPAGRVTVRASVRDSRGQDGFAEVELRVVPMLEHAVTRDGSVPEEGYVDMWEIEAEAGDVVALTLGVTSSVRFRPRIRVEAPDGAVVATTGSSTATLVLDAPVTGTYRVLVDSDGPSGGGYGEYRLTGVAFDPHAGSVGAVDGGSLVNGGNHHGALEVAGMEIWRFEAGEGDYLALSVGPHDPASEFEPQIVLIAPDGVARSPSPRDPVKFQGLRAEAAGTWLVIVVEHTRSGARGGGYVLTHVHVPGDAVVPEGDDGGDLTNGATHAGTTFPADLDPWTFHAEEGDFLALGAHAGDLQLQLVLVSPTGELVGAYGSWVETVAPESGTYTVIVRMWYWQLATADYELTLARVPGDFTVPPGDEGGALANGALVTGALGPGDLDLWTFTADEGDWLGMGMGRAGPTEDLSPRLVLVAPSGAVVEATEASRSVYVEAEAPESGTYTVLARSSGSGTGAYRLVATRVPGDLVVAEGDEGGPLTDGTGHAGSILLGDLDAWTFVGAAGETVALDVVEQDPQTDVTLRIVLLSPEGAVVESAWGGQEARIEATLDATGTYTVVVGPYHPNQHGAADYVLTLTR